MKIKQQIAIISFGCLFLTGELVAQHHAEQKIKAVPKTVIALLGVYHFSNPNQDQFNVKSDNVLSEKRQKELEALVKELARFKPTHIALEFNKSDSALDKRYQEYLKGKYQLGTGEDEQLGFRLAGILGHQHIYPVDEPSIQLDFDPGELAAEFSPLLQQLSETGNNVIGQINKWVQEKSIGAVLSQLNSQELDKMNIDLYYRFLLPIGKGNMQPGLDGVVSWYKRNLYILKHIKEITGANQSEKRVLVIFGQGHTAMLKQFLQYSTEFELVDIQQFLPKQ